MVGAGDVIANGFGRVGTEENGPGMADFLEYRPGFGQHELQMLWRHAVGERHRLLPVAHQNDRAMAAPALTCDGGARQGGECGFHRVQHGFGQRRVIRDENGLRVFVMLGLGQQVQRQMRRVVGGVRRCGRPSQ